MGRGVLDGPGNGWSETAGGLEDLLSFVTFETFWHEFFLN